MGAVHFWQFVLTMLTIFDNFDTLLTILTIDIFSKICWQFWQSICFSKFWQCSQMLTLFLTMVTIFYIFLICRQMLIFFNFFYIFSPRFWHLLTVCQFRQFQYFFYYFDNGNPGDLRHLRRLDTALWAKLNVNFFFFLEIVLIFITDEDAFMVA